MKQTKGFAQIIILVVMGVLIVGGIVYVVAKNPLSPPSPGNLPPSDDGGYDAVKLKTHTSGNISFEYPTDFIVSESSYTTPGGGSYPKTFVIKKTGGATEDVVTVVNQFPQSTTEFNCTNQSKCENISGEYRIWTNSKDSSVLNAYGTVKNSWGSLGTVKSVNAITLENRIKTAVDGILLQAAPSGSKLLSAKLDVVGDTAKLTLNFNGITVSKDNGPITEDGFSRISNAVHPIVQGTGIDPKYKFLNFVILIDGKNFNPATVVNVPVFTDGGDVVCGQKIVYVKRTVPSTQATLNATFRELFAMSNPYIENGKEYSNPIGYQTTKKEFPPLKFIRADLVNGVASIYLEGSITGVGTCYDPLPAIQMSTAAKQFSTVTSIKFYLNGRETNPGCIANEKDGQGSCYTGVN